MIRIISFIMLTCFLIVSVGCVTWTDRETGEGFFVGDWDKEVQPGVVTLLNSNGTNETVVIKRLGRPNKVREMINYRTLGWSYGLCEIFDANITPWQRLDSECSEYVVAVTFDIRSGRVAEYETGYLWEPTLIKQWSTTPIITRSIDIAIQKHTLDNVMDRLVNKLAGRLDKVGDRISSSVEDAVDSVEEAIEEGIANVDDAIQE